MAAAAIDGIKPTTTGGEWKQGAWYNGRQYWNGTLSAPGVIHSQSDQVGAGQAVSNEVLRQTSVAAGKAPDANQKYIQAETVKYNTGGNTSLSSGGFDVGSFLSTYQDSMFSTGGSGVAASLLPNTPAPTPINRTQMYGDLRLDMGVDALETDLNSIKEQERTLMAQVRENQIDEEGRPVALNVMGGRINETKRQAQIDLDFLNVRKATLVDELTTKYNAINMFINFAGLDYQDAKAAYDSEFDKNVKIAQFISGEKQNAITNARANLTTMVNLITSGNMSVGSLSNDEKLQITKLEAQSGLPIGTISRLQMSPKDKMLGFSDDKSQVMMLDENGGFKVVSTGIKGSSSTGKMTEDEFKRTASSEMSGFLDQYANSYGHVGGDTYLYARKKWMAETGETNTDNFDAMFRDYRDPYNLGQYKLSIDEESR